MSLLHEVRQALKWVFVE